MVYRENTDDIQRIPLQATDLEMAFAGVKTFLQRMFPGELRVCLAVMLFVSQHYAQLMRRFSVAKDTGPATPKQLELLRKLVPRSHSCRETDSTHVLKS